MAKKNRCVNIDSNRVKGLLVGINYRGTSNALGGCINDVNAMKKLITNTYPNAQLEIMTDDTKDQPTRDNILRKLKNLVDNANAGDLLIFNYSGHGSQVQDIHGDEADGLDETICPIDFMKRRTITYKGRTYVMDSQITNDEINEIITKVPKNAKFFMLSDSCHSGTIGDLKNDFLRYDGPSIWPNKLFNSELTDADPSKNNSINKLESSVEIEKIEDPNINLIEYPSKASWIYVENNGIPEIWLTPQTFEVFQKFNSAKHVIKVDNKDEIPALLKTNKNKPYSCLTVFKQKNSREFIVEAPDLGINNLKIMLNAKVMQEPLTNRSVNSSFCSQPNTPSLVLLPNGEQIICSDKFSSVYDEDHGEHCHVNHTTGQKNTFQMRCPGGCTGGELRIISGCAENQTSADTGRNGACTLAFFDTVSRLGGLDKLFKKLFSHNIQDLKLVQDHINSFLIKFGFTQNSMVSWDHSAATRGMYLPGFLSKSELSRRSSNCYDNIKVMDPSMLDKTIIDDNYTQEMVNRLKSDNIKYLI